MKQLISSPEKTSLVSGYKEENIPGANDFSRYNVTGLIRFEEKRESYAWVEPAKILFVKSADHYVRSLVQDGDKKKWMIRHCTIKDLLATLSPGDFVRLNRFYILNTSHFSHINEQEKTIYLDDDFSIPAPHRISRYILELLKQITYVKCISRNNLDNSFPQR